MPDRYTRFGEFFLQGVLETLGPGTPIDVPHVGRCTVRSLLEPHLHRGNWSAQIDIAFPGDSMSHMKFGVYTFGSRLLDDTEKVGLPEPTYEDEQDKQFPPAHQEAWSRLLDALETELETAGHDIDSSDDADFFIDDDYMPSSGISCSVLKPGLVTPELLTLCQRLVQAEPQWNLSVRLGFDFVDDRHKGHRESILVRPDRVVHDYDAERLRAEFGADLPLVAQS